MNTGMPSIDESFTVSAMKVFPRTHELPSSQALQQGAASPNMPRRRHAGIPPPPLRRRCAIMPLKRWISVRGTFRKHLPPFNPRSSRKQEQRAAVDRQPFLSEIKPPSPLDKANRGAESERGESHQRRSRPPRPDAERPPEESTRTNSRLPQKNRLPLSCRPSIFPVL